MKPYPAYKDSGVEWLGEVPEGWEVVPVKARLSVVGGTTPKSDQPAFWDGDIPWITPADLSSLPDRFIFETGRQITQLGLDSCGTTIVPAGSIVLSTRAPIGSIAVTTVPSCINQGCKLLVPRQGSDADYYYYALLSAREQLNVLGRGSTFLELSGDQLAAFRVPLPPLPEQQAIAAFLDRETAKIDGLIEEQRRLIALLAEKRQATISQAVTRGLNPDASLKPSGVDWLGDVPEGWEVVPLKHLSEKIGSGKTPSGGAEVYQSSGVMFLRSQNVYETGLRLDDVVFISDEIDREMSGTRVKPGDILLNITGASLGRTSIVPPDFEPANVNQHVCIIRIARENLAPFVSLFMQSAAAKGQIFATLNGAARDGLNFEQIGSFGVPIPPDDQWDAIFQQVNAVISQLGTLTETATTAITLLQERRAALISAAVTGKIDVRDLAPAKAA